jgi:hypothetical protein
MTRARDHGILLARSHHDSQASDFIGPERDDLLAALHLCLRGERVFTSALRREIAARGVDLEALAHQVGPASRTTDVARTATSR